jgi:hypothetical protein
MAVVRWAGSSGNWSLATNWSGGIVPSVVDDVTIDASGSYTVNVNGTFDVNSIYIRRAGGNDQYPLGRRACRHSRRDDNRRHD